MYFTLALNGTQIESASAAPCAALLSSLEPEWTAVLVTSTPLSADDQDTRSEQRSAAAAATAGLHEALVGAKTGTLLGVLSDGAASYTIARVWETVLEKLEYSLYNGEPHTDALVQGHRSPPRDLPASQLFAAISRAGEIVSAAVSTGGNGAAVVAAATKKMLRLCKLAEESTPALLDLYTSGTDAIHSAGRLDGGTTDSYKGHNADLALQVQVRRLRCTVLGVGGGTAAAIAVNVCC